MTSDLERMRRIAMEMHQVGGFDADADFMAAAADEIQRLRAEVSDLTMDLIECDEVERELRADLARRGAVES